MGPLIGGERLGCAAKVRPGCMLAHIDFLNLGNRQAVHRVQVIHHEHEGVAAEGHIHQLYPRVRGGLALVGVGIGGQHQVNGVGVVHHDALALDGHQGIGLALGQAVVGVRRGGEGDEAVHVPFLQAQPLPGQLHGHGHADRAAVHAGVGAPIADEQIVVALQGLLFTQAEGIVRFQFRPTLALAAGLVDLTPGAGIGILRQRGQIAQHTNQQCTKQTFHFSFPLF